MSCCCLSSKRPAAISAISGRDTLAGLLLVDGSNCGAATLAAPAKPPPLLLPLLLLLLLLLRRLGELESSRPARETEGEEDDEARCGGR